MVSGHIINQMKRIHYLILSLLTLFGCNSSPKKNQNSVQKCDTAINIFVNKNINLDSCTIINDPENRTNLSIIKKNDKFGLINNIKQLVLPCVYDSIERPHLADYFFISKNGLFGVVTTKGILTIPIIYEQIEYEWKNQQSDDEDNFIVQKNKKLGTIDFHNNTIIPIEYDGISNWVEYGPDAHYVKKGCHYGIVDYKTGKLIIPVLYDGICNHKGLIEIKMQGSYGIITLKNEEIIPCIYDRIFEDIDLFGFDKNHKDRIFARKNSIWYEFFLSGKISKSNISTKDINKDFLNYIPDSNEYSYHLKDCMVFPK